MEFHLLASTPLGGACTDALHISAGYLANHPASSLGQRAEEKPAVVWKPSGRALTGLSVELIYPREVPGNAAAIVIHLNAFKHPFVTRKR